MESQRTVRRIEIETHPRARFDGRAVDPTARDLLDKMRNWVGIVPRRIATRKVYLLDIAMSDAEAQRVLEALVDPVGERGCLGRLDDRADDDGTLPWVVTVHFLPGVTDVVGRTVRRVVSDELGRPIEGAAASGRQVLLWGLEREDVERVAREVLYNPLIERVRIERPPRSDDVEFPRAGVPQTPPVRTVPLRDADDETLLSISRKGMLALSLAEMRAIAAHFRACGRDPTDAELECLAQTWSEHCKHKIFSARIDYTGPDGERRIVDGLFKTFIRAATDEVARNRAAAGIDGGAPFLVSVFHDNAGVVRFTERDHLVYKVETHNSPSALDPYGGALTGIVGVNRDSFGTGIGADLLANVWGYCFGPPDYAGRLPEGLMHPRRIRDGVHHGVIDGGNHSGIPYMRGWEIFDPCYAGKPLVFCGTVAVMPVESAGRPTHEKPVSVGDFVVMVGGRIGKDGIHGATFSSLELSAEAPVRAVQLGDPIVQKMMFDALTEARDLGLVSGLTDNGAGGLSSSVGEMAELTGGARIDLARAPLKYPGLAPWEILVSEAQERMTVAVPPDRIDAFLDLCARREVEATVLGTFTDTGRFEVFYGDAQVVDLPLEFLHDGVPRMELSAEWSPRAVTPTSNRVSHPSVADALLGLLARPGFASLEHYARHYDHEVKGLSVVKPLLGVRGDVPATATVMRARHGRDEGVVLAEGVHPFYGAFDPKVMAHAAVEEGVRRVLCAGARIDRIAALDNFCWPDPIASEKTPDGRFKLGQLVRCCEGLYEACVAFGVPLVSGKDSMKNDAVFEGVKISILPTLLVSVLGQMDDVRRAITLRPSRPGDVLFLLGPPDAAPVLTEYERAFGVPPGDTAPPPSPETCRSWARAFVDVRDRGWVRAAHAAGRGGLAVALAHMVLASDLGLDVVLDSVPADARAVLFGENLGRYLAVVPDEHAEAFAAATSAHRIGTVTETGRLAIRRKGRTLAALDVDTLRRAYRTEEDAHG
ncbi:MAG: phosphoribosylformylglycinamidine synthase [Deltaproteobacteria bacterium]|nr:MAG: phosphoribosylformylglycinamidine synthase [Deltaproteobacteria bacterium]